MRSAYEGAIFILHVVANVSLSTGKKSVDGARTQFYFKITLNADVVSTLYIILENWASKFHNSLAHEYSSFSVLESMKAISSLAVPSISCAPTYYIRGFLHLGRPVAVARRRDRATSDLIFLLLMYDF